MEKCHVESKLKDDGLFRETMLCFCFLNFCPLFLCKEKTENHCISQTGSEGIMSLALQAAQTFTSTLSPVKQKISYQKEKTVIF